MAKKYIGLKRHVMEYSPGELRDLLGGLKKSELLRSIILNEKQFLKVDYNRSLRGFWYSTVKPTLSKLGLLTEIDQTEEKLQRWDAELSRYCAELIRLGALSSYSDIKIVDASRQRENPGNRYKVNHLETYGYQVTVSPYSNIILGTEKDTIYEIITDLARFFGCSCISGHGQNSFSAMEDLLRGVNKKENVYILTLTDYDPAGDSISETFFNQAMDLRRALGITGRITIERLGITPRQLTAPEVEANKYVPKEKGRAEWANKTGGINGEPYGLELDSLPPERIREIFVTSIKKYIKDQKPYKEFIKGAYIQSIILKGIKDKIAGITEDIISREEGNIEGYDFDIFDLASLGYNEIPIDRLCSNNRDGAIIERALSYFKET